MPRFYRGVLILGSLLDVLLSSGFLLLLFRRYLEILCDAKDLHVESVLLGKYNHFFFFFRFSISLS